MTVGSLLMRLLIACFAFTLCMPSLADDADRMTAPEVNRLLMAYYDSYQEALSETIDRILAAEPEPDKRLIFQTVKVFYTNSALDIVTSPDVGRQLMDLLIMVRLQRMVWSDGGPEYATAEEAESMLSALSRLEAPLERLAARVFDDEVVSAVYRAAEDWRARNPDREYVAFVRLDGLPDTDEKQALQQQAGGRGLFARIAETNEEIEEARFAAERALFFANHLPIMAQWQSELLLYRALSTSEISALVADVGDFVAVADRLVTVIDELPAELAEALGQNQESLEMISEDVRISSANFRVITERIAPLFERRDDDQDGEIELAQLERIVASLATASDRLSATAEDIAAITYNEESIEHAAEQIALLIAESAVLMDRRIAAADERIAAEISRAFRLSLVLIVVLFVAALVLIRYSKSFDDRNAGEGNRRDIGDRTS